jgi:hypothetical protein
MIDRPRQQAGRRLPGACCCVAEEQAAGRDLDPVAGSLGPLGARLPVCVSGTEGMLSCGHIVGTLPDAAG